MPTVYEGNVRKEENFHKFFKNNGDLFFCIYVNQLYGFFFFSILVHLHLDNTEGTMLPVYS